MLNFMIKAVRVGGASKNNTQDKINNEQYA